MKDCLRHPLHKQLAHFGKGAATQMVKNELSSWLQELNIEPSIISITPLTAAYGRPTPPKQTQTKYSKNKF